MAGGSPSNGICLHGPRKGEDVSRAHNRCKEKSEHGSRNRKPGTINYNEEDVEQLTP